MVTQTQVDQQFEKHLKTVTDRLFATMENLNIDELIIDASSPHTPMFDTHTLPFTSNPYFRYLCPDQRPESFCHLIPGEKPRLFRSTPMDYWYDVMPMEGGWQQHFNISLENDMTKAWESLKPGTGITHYIGDQKTKAAERGFIVNDRALLYRFDWHRTQKTPYEISCLREANRIAARGHLKVLEGFSKGETEFSVYLEYLRAVGQIPDMLPYNAIIGYDEKSAVLHYEHKRQVKGERVLLIDAGARFLGYGSDITRTYLHPEAKGPAANLFGSLITKLNQAQQRLCSQVTVGINYGALHHASHLEIAEILLEHDLIKGVTPDEALARQVTQAFYPHGLGHMLGLLVHDVGGQQQDAIGTPCAPHPEFPRLRTARSLKIDEVITCEPGLYFIPLLLEAARKDERQNLINWPLVDTLVPFGGIRVEDDLVVTTAEPINLTRAFLP